MIDNITVCCYKGDYWLAKICVASIRYWYPDISILLLKDLKAGDFSTKEVELAWNVDVFKGPFTKFGSPISKLEAFFTEDGKKSLVLDADIVFIGPLLDLLSQYSEDIILSPSYIEDPHSEHIQRLYYEFSRLSRFDPDFEYPGWVFNAGQFVVAGGKLTRDYFKNYVTWTNDATSVELPDFIKYHDQGLLNYLLPKAEALGKIKLALVPFKIFANKRTDMPVTIQDVLEKRGAERLLHFAGQKFPIPSLFSQGEFMFFYQKLYYSKVPSGGLKRIARNIHRYIQWMPNALLRLIWNSTPSRLKPELKKAFSKLS